MLRLSSQSLSAFRRRKILPCIQQQVRKYSDTEPPPSAWQNEVVVIEEESKAPWRDRVSTELSDDAPVYPTVLESPERDLVNFPRRKWPEKPAPTRLVIFPENWFKFMHSKMGVSGPYTLGLGFILFMVQKEYFITHGPEWEHVVAWYMWWYTCTRTQLGNIACYALNTYTRASIEGAREYETIGKRHRVEAIEHEKEQQGVAQSLTSLFDVKKQNVGLQLEAAYRESAMDIYNQVKRRLDYQVEVGKIDSRIKQQFMVNWVINQVQQSLRKTSEVDTLKQCLSDLNTLAARA